MTVLRKSSFLITGVAGLSFLDKARKAKHIPDSGTSLRSCQQQQYPTCTREKAVNHLKEMRAQRGEKKELTSVELEQLEEDVQGMELESRLINGVELFTDSVPPVKFRESDDGSDIETGFYVVNGTRIGMMQMAKQPAGESAGSGAVATGEQRPGQEETCGAERHPYKCMMLGVKSGCAWSYHPDCGPQVGSCVAWQRGKQNGIDAEFKSCGDWKEYQEEGGKTGACPGNDDDKNILVEKLYCGKKVPEDLLAAEKTVEEESKGKPAPICKEGDVRVAEGSPNRADVQMYGEVLMKGKWYPICGHHFWDSDDGANVFCRRLGFWGGVAQKTHVVFESDAVEVGKCDNKSPSIDKCSSGGNAFSDLDYNNGWCKKGNKVGVSFKCKGMEAEGLRRNSCGNSLECFGVGGNGWQNCHEKRCKPLEERAKEEGTLLNAKCGFNWKDMIHNEMEYKGILTGCSWRFIDTEGKTCDEWCKEKKLHCLMGQIAGEGCSLNPDKTLNTERNGDVRHGCEMSMKSGEKSMCQCGLKDFLGFIPGLDGIAGSAPVDL